MGVACLLLMLASQPAVCRMPSISDSCDVIVVMMEDGLLPQEPWAGLSDYRCEQLWSLACRGMMVERNGWAGYVLLVPCGTGEDLIAAAESLAAAPGIPHECGWRGGMGISPVSDCPSTILLFSPGGVGPSPSSLPLTSSSWLLEPPDTVMVESDEGGSAFFWTGLPDSVSVSFAGSAWRGTGTEVVPSGGTSVVVAWSSVLGSVPSNLSAVDPGVHPMDGGFSRTYGAALAAVDSMIAAMLPLREDEGHLLWVRGSGAGTRPPFRTAPSAPTPFAVRHAISLPESWTGTAMAGMGDPATIPGAVGVELPGLMEDPSLAPVIEAVLERVLATSVVPLLGFDCQFGVGSGDDGGMTVWLASPGGGPLPEDASEALLRTLHDALLVPPGGILLENAATRASIVLGRTVEPPPENEVARELMYLLDPGRGG